ncbi:MAG: MBL fold metallo-hydrolase [Alistipes indistinctus]
MIKIGVLPFNPFRRTRSSSYRTRPANASLSMRATTMHWENAALSKYISDNGLKPVMAVNTHGPRRYHMLSGLNHVKETYHIPFAIHGKDKFLIESAPTHGAIYGFQVDKVPTSGYRPRRAKRAEIRQHDVPDHPKPGTCPRDISLALHNPENKLLLTGDTLFRESIEPDRPAGRRLRLDHAQHPRQD